MRQLAASSQIVLLLLAFHPVVSASGEKAAEKPDFSGSYTLKKDPGSTLRVIQTENTVEVARAVNGNENKNVFRIDGSEGRYKSTGGLMGICKGQLKGKELILDIVIPIRPPNNGPDVQMHTRERWKLSSDSKTLTIRINVDSAQSPLGGFEVVDPWSEIYSRN